MMIMKTQIQPKTNEIMKTSSSKLNLYILNPVWRQLKREKSRRKSIQNRISIQKLYNGNALNSHTCSNT